MIKTLKSEYRHKYLCIRDGLSEREIVEKSAAAGAHLLKTSEYVNCETLLIYKNFGSEAVTSGIIKDALDKGKIVALPRLTDKKNREMAFFRISSDEIFIVNSFGVSEPAFDPKKIVTCDHKTLIVAPGAAFSENGSRIGYGGGYYDRYLSLNKYHKCIGFCFAAQFIAYVPSDETDVKMDAVVTEEGLRLLKPNIII